MSTVATIQNRAARLLGKLASGSSLGSDEASDALTALNALLESWRNDDLFCYALQDETLTLSNGTSSYTIGPGGDLNTTRPVTIENAWIEASNISYPVRLIPDDEYAAIPDKAASADWPDRANYRPTMSTGTLRVWPVPNAARTMKLTTRVVVSSFSATTDTVTLPPGWEEALATNLAIALAPEYGAIVSAEVAKMARSSLARLRRVNYRPPMAVSDLGRLISGRTVGYNILTDQ